VLFWEFSRTVQFDELRSRLGPGGHIPPDARVLEPGIRWWFGGCLLLGKREASWRSYLTWLRVVRKASVERQYFRCDWGAWIPAQNDFVPPHFPTIYLERCALDTHASGIFGWLQACTGPPRSRASPAEGPTSRRKWSVWALLLVMPSTKGHYQI
jgi:hypothetical protein